MTERQLRTLRSPAALHRANGLRSSARRISATSPRTPGAGRNAIEGARLRLAYLGYYRGEVVGQLSPWTQAVIRHFQADNEIEATGELDQATARKLKDVHIA